jgi:serine/threonine protein kinase
MIFENINLLLYGIPYNGPFNGIKYLSSYWVPQLDSGDSYEYEGADGVKYKRRFVVIDKAGSVLGTYGDIEMVLCNGEDVLIRKFSRNGDSLFCEACFQVAAWQILKKFGLEGAISRVTDIIRRPSPRDQVGFVMEPFLNVDTIGNILAELGDRVTDVFIANCISQVALVLWVLETTLGLNHRDLKGDNILLGSLKAPAKKITVAHKGMTITVMPLVNVHIVDFGFACNGNGAEGTEVSATNYFPCTDPCPKMGRDIFQLCTFLYMSARVRPYLGRLGPLFEKWLTLPGKDFPAYLRTKNESDTEWIYFLLSSSRFHAEACEPLAVLIDLAAVFPDIIKIDRSPPK